MFEHNIETDIKEYIKDLKFGSVEQNSLYAKCIYELKYVDYLTGKDYKRALESICNHYLS